MDEKPELAASERAFHGRVFDVRVDRIRYADGAEHRVDVVVHPGSVLVIPLMSPREIVLVRQYRHPIARSLWEIPAGTSEPGEDPIDGARRELREETGYSAASLRPLGTLAMTPGICSELSHFFVAEGLEPGEQALDTDERIAVKTFTIEEAWRSVASGEIADAKTVLALLWTESKRGEIGAAIGR